MHQASWWLFEGSEQWATVYRMQSECGFDAQIRVAKALCLPHTDGVERDPLFFLRADGKAHMILACGDGFTKTTPGAMVCHCCGKNMETVLQCFGGARWPWHKLKGNRALRVCAEASLHSGASLTAVHTACCLLHIVPWMGW